MLACGEAWNPVVVAGVALICEVWKSSVLVAVVTCCPVLSCTDACISLLVGGKAVISAEGCTSVVSFAETSEKMKLLFESCVLRSSSVFTGVGCVPPVFVCEDCEDV